MKYEILASGSKGNATLIEDRILVDCGVPFKAFGEKWRKIKLVLLTHEHSDHFCKSTIRALALLRPTLRFGCGKWLVPHLLRCGVAPDNIDVYEMDKRYSYGTVAVEPFELTHNVRNCGYKIHLPAGRCIYATDANNLNGVSAKNYDVYFVEANYGEDEIEERIKEKEAEGVYAYEVAARVNHLSREKCETWLNRNIGENSECVLMHVHEA